MIAKHLIPFLTAHHSNGSEPFAILIEELCEAFSKGSSCLPIAHSSVGRAVALEALSCGEAGSVVGFPGSLEPLILTGSEKLYLNRYFSYEYEIAESLSARLSRPAMPWSEGLETKLSNLFGEVVGNDQAEAARKAVKNRFSIISGGPGTGKTTTVLKILRLLKELQVFSESRDVMLLAPTGKAADRLRQSITEGLHYEGIDASSFPSETSTIHRALGYRPNSINFRHDSKNPLRAKVVIIDESSMVDLPLMAKLFRAIPEDTKLILLGDQHQLTSVEVGSVLADLIDSHSSVNSIMKDAVTVLQKSYRNKGVIHHSCQAIKAGEAELALDLIRKASPTEDGIVTCAPLPTQLKSSLSHFVETHWVPALKNDSLSHEERLSMIDEFRILTPTHSGMYGIEAINAAVESILRAHGIGLLEQWYEGRSVIIQENDNHLGIYNGDIGLCVRDKKGGLKVAFHSEEGVRYLPPALLPAVKTAWALTIHRTQGSEYKHLLLILPDFSGEVALVTRELLYTGLSRAKSSATIWSAEHTFLDTVTQQAQRASGLNDLL